MSIADDGWVIVLADPVKQAPVLTHEAVNHCYTLVLGS
jgi:hypothetical protein